VSGDGPSGPGGPSLDVGPDVGPNSVLHHSAFSARTWEEASGVAAHLIVLFVAVIMAGTLVIQLIEPAYPCPLCLVQRMCLFLAAMGPALLIVRSDQKRHRDRMRVVTKMYGMTLMACVLGLLVGGRQLLLHAGGQASYVAPLLGQTLPVWGIIVSLCLIFVAGIHLLFVEKLVPIKPPRPHILSHFLVWFFGLLVLTNIVLTFALSGFEWMVPDDAQGYRLIHVSSQQPTTNLQVGGSESMVFIIIGIASLAVYWGIALWMLRSVKHRHEKARRRAIHFFILAAVGFGVTVLLGFGTELVMAATGMVEVGHAGEHGASAAKAVFSGAAWWFMLGSFVLLVVPTVVLGFHMLRLHREHVGRGDSAGGEN
jgi:disulfide bond formation protein DsbB